MAQRQRQDSGSQSRVTDLPRYTEEGLPLDGVGRPAPMSQAIRNVCDARHLCYVCRRAGHSSSNCPNVENTTNGAAAQSVAPVTTGSTARGPATGMQTQSEGTAGRPRARTVGTAAQKAAAQTTGMTLCDGKKIEFGDVEENMLSELKKELPNHMANGKIVFEVNLPDEALRYVFVLAHTDPMSAHRSKQRTIDIVLAVMFWPNAVADLRCLQKLFLLSKGESEASEDGRHGIASGIWTHGELVCGFCWTV